MSGTLFLVATPIGNWEDISFRALRILKEVDVIVYEEHREGRRLLAHYNIPEKITETLNEHDEEESSTRIIYYLTQGKNVALISDAGTPVFSDPGQTLVRMAIDNNINIIPIPGASSIIPALILSGFATTEFYFYGFLSQKSELRINELRSLRSQQRTMIFLDAPYRLVPLLNDISKTFGDKRRICIAYNLTMPDEQIFRGTAEELYQRFLKNKIKGEFVLVVDGERKRKDEGIKYHISYLTSSLASAFAFLYIFLG
ncbi:MAG: 16S rRNA (cytidine(1402)-2'-O)-methyltransferase [Chlorobiaceae bacterium]|nr:16S rRNA (cytidine(1402)-2'-O)-methyltransferase [Chlorobiaceae bacterium]